MSLCINSFGTISLKVSEFLVRYLSVYSYQYIGTTFLWISVLVRYLSMYQYLQGKLLTSRIGTVSLCVPGRIGTVRFCIPMLVWYFYMSQYWYGTAPCTCMSRCTVSLSVYVPYLSTVSCMHTRDAHANWIREAAGCARNATATERNVWVRGH